MCRNVRYINNFILNNYKFHLLFHDFILLKIINKKVLTLSKNQYEAMTDIASKCSFNKIMKQDYDVLATFLLLATQLHKTVL